MLTPVFSMGQDYCIVLDKSFRFSTMEKAIEYGFLALTQLAYIDLSFNGDVVRVDEKSQIVPIKLPTTDLNEIFIIGLISGPTYDAIRAGKKLDGIVLVSPDKLQDNIYLTDNVYMESKTFSIAIGIADESYEPYVLISFGGDTQAVSPATARSIADDLQFAAKASEVDSFFYRSLKEVFKDIPESKRDDFMEAYRNFREQYRVINEEETANSEEVSQGENKEGQSTEGGTPKGEEVGNDEAEKEALDKAIKKANRKGTTKKDKGDNL